MTEKVLLWKGFSTLVYWKKQDGQGQHLRVTGTTTGTRQTPEEAWEDARRLEDGHDRYVKEHNIKRDTVNVFTGVCPADYMA